MSGSGIIVAIILMVLFTFFNLVGIKWLARINNALTTWKVIIPVLAIVVLMLTHFHSGNFTAGGGFFVHGAEVKRHPDRHPERRHRFLAARFRAGRPARW